jgi:hypothetical protein
MSQMKLQTMPMTVMIEEMEVILSVSVLLSTPV